MQKRKASDSGFQSEQKKHLTEKEKHAENIVDAMKINTISGMETELTIGTLLVDQGCTYCSTSSGSSFTEKGSSRKITDETSADNNFMSAEKEKCSSMGGACGYSDEIGSNSVVVESISNIHEASETKKNEILDCHYKLDRNNPSAINPSLSGAVKLDLEGTKDSYMTTSSNDTSNNESTIPFHVSSNLHKAEKEPDKYVQFSSCDIEVVLKDSFDGRLQVMEGSLTGNSENEPAPEGTLLVDQGCTSCSTSSLSSFTEKGSSRKITDETSADNNFMSAEKENCSSMGGACGYSDEIGSNSVVVESISNIHEASETKKNEILDCHYKLDRNDSSAINPSLSGAVKLDLEGTEDSYMTRSSNDTSNNESTISFHVSSNLHQAEKEPDKYVRFSSCDIEVVLKDSFDGRLQVMEGSLTGNSENEPAPEGTLLVDQGCTSCSTSSLSSFTEKGSSRKITDETSAGNIFMSAEKENCSSMGGACVYSDEIGSNSVVVESISNIHEASETKKNEILDCHYKLDRNDPSAINPSLSGAVKLYLEGTEDSYMTTGSNDMSNNESTISFRVSSNLHQAEKEPDKYMRFSSCDIEVVLKDSFDARLQVMEGSLTGNSENEPAPEELQKLRDKDANDVIHEPNGSKDALAHESEDLADESGKMAEAHGIFAERNPKEFSADCREHPSPIREKFLADNQSEKASSVVESDEVFQTIKENNDSSISSCIVSAITNGLENKEDSILMSHTSDVVNSQDKRLEAVIMEPERSFVSCTRKKLLILDLNGLLADIILDIRNVHRARKKVGGKAVFKRPFCDDFLKFCFEKFEIGVWSSRRKYNVDSVLDFLMGEIRHKLLFCWDQSHCTYTGFKTPENVHKPLVLKELKKLWNKEVADLPWEMGDYSSANTLLVDDSPYKALCNPPHTAIFPYPYRFDDENDISLGPGGDLRVYLEGLYEADDVQLYVQQHPFGQEAITNTDSSWNFYLQVIEKVEQSVVQTQ